MDDSLYGLIFVQGCFKLPSSEVTLIFRVDLVALFTQYLVHLFIPIWVGIEDQVLLSPPIFLNFFSHFTDVCHFLIRMHEFLNLFKISQQFTWLS